MSERLALAPVVVIIVVSGGIVMVYLVQELGKWLVRVSERREAARVVGSRDRSLPGKARVRARRSR